MALLKDSNLEQAQETNKTIETKKGILSFFQKLWGFRLLRFGAVGVINTLFSYALYAFLVFIGLNYTWAKVISTILGIIFAFFTTGRIVYNNNQNKLILRFVLVYAVTMSLDVLFLRLLVENFKVNEYLAGAITVMPIGLLSYLFNSIFTFKTIKLFNKSPEDSNG